MVGTELQPSCLKQFILSMKKSKLIQIFLLFLEDILQFWKKTVKFIKWFYVFQGLILVVVLTDFILKTELVLQISLAQPSRLSLV